MIKEIFRTGKWTSAEGKTKEWKESDIDRIISKFDASKKATLAGRRVPLTVGHPDDNAPAFGWLGRLWREGKKLMGEFEDIVPLMKQWIVQKSYREVSIALNNDGSLRHVGVLGGVPPAVPAMGDWKFSNDKFTIPGQNETVPAFAFEGNKDYNELTFKSETQKGDLNMDKELKDALDKINKLEGKVSDFEGKYNDLKSENEELKTKLTESEGKFAKKEEDYNKLLKDQETERERVADEAGASFIDGEIKAKRIAPKDREIELFNLKARRGQEMVSFTADDGTVTKKSPVQVYKESIQARQELIDTDFSFSGGVEKPATKEAKLIKLTEEYAEKNNLSFADAGPKVLELHPELNEGGE